MAVPTAEDAADRPFGYFEPLSHPLNTVGEEFASDEDDHETEKEDDQVHLKL